MLRIPHPDLHAICSRSTHESKFKPSVLHANSTHPYILRLRLNLQSFERFHLMYLSWIKYGTKQRIYQMDTSMVDHRMRNGFYNPSWNSVNKFYVISVILPLTT